LVPAVPVSTGCNSQSPGLSRAEAAQAPQTQNLSALSQPSWSGLPGRDWPILQKVLKSENIDGVTYSLSEDIKILTLYWGEKPTGGYSISIESVFLDGSTLMVIYRLKYPNPSGVVITVLTYPQSSVSLPPDIISFTGVKLIRADDLNRVIFTIDKNIYKAGKNSVSMNATPFMENGRAFVPVRYLSTALGVSEDRVIWSPRDATVTLIKSDTNVRFAVGKSTFYINNEPVTMNSAPILREGRVYLPARYLSEALGYRAIWDAAENSVVIMKYSIY